jgi:hypothetical protein
VSHFRGWTRIGACQTLLFSMVAAVEDGGPYEWPEHGGQDQERKDAQNNQLGGAHRNPRI